jgi:hypothetical protein
MSLRHDESTVQGSQGTNILATKTVWERHYLSPALFRRNEEGTDLLSEEIMKGPHQ